MAQRIEPHDGFSLERYQGMAHLNGAVRALREEAARLAPVLAGRRVWMVNSTARGGGVAELMGPLVGVLRELGVEAEWLVMETDEPGFFALTKRLHNLIHDQGDPHLTTPDRDLYERVSRASADQIQAHMDAGDVLVIHDPQPMGAGAILRARMDIAAVWRCHIGLGLDTPRTRAAWQFLEGFAPLYDRGVFTAAEYIPGCFAGRAATIPPGIDPLSHKNRVLPIHKLVGILVDAALQAPLGPVLAPPFESVVQRLQPDGGWAPAADGADIGLLFRPIVTQVSRWDRLKGFLPLMEGFVRMKRMAKHDPPDNERARRALAHARLVMAGPEPGAVADDPEAREVLEEICAAYRALPAAEQADICVLSLPMSSQKENALIVNALQRCSDVVAQNSLQEGFGLTATEAMWKRVAVMGTHAVGLRHQIRDGLDGRLVCDPQDADEVARTLGELLCDPDARDALARSAEERVHEEFLVFTEVRRWLEELAQVARTRWP
ncbi:MAG: glycosyltransferase [Pseudomonadota bacterium]